MANWNLPTVTSGYLDFVAEMNSKFVDAGTIGFGSPTNLPENAMRFNRSINIFEEWVGGAWVAKTIALAGGGTGASTAAGARTNLGIGSMGTQNSNAVNITGGSITGVAFSGSDITTGILALARGGTGASLGLGPNGWVLLSNGAQTLFSPGIYIGELNASNLSMGIVNDARLSANVPLLSGKTNIWGDFQNAFTGYVTFQGSGGSYAPTIISTGPTLNFYDSDQPANQHYIRLVVQGNGFYVEQVDDAYAATQTFLRVMSDAMYVAGGAGQVVGQGTYITNLNASNLTSGLVAISRLAGGPVGDTRYFLRNDQTWAIPPGGTGETSGIPSGLIAIFDTGCPAGWTRVSGLDDRFPRGSPNYGSTGGRWSHAHGVGGQTGAAGGHSHSFSGSGSGSGSGRTGELDSAMNFQPGPNLGAGWSHTHPFSVNVNVSVEGNTGGVGDHAHSFNVGTSEEDHTLPYMTVVFCRKN